MRTYGAVSYDARWKRWDVECEPQVALRFKRVFGKMSKAAQGTLSLSDTPENARELAWFLERYPMRMEEGDREALAAHAEQHRRFTEELGHVLSGDYTPREFTLALPPRAYQRLAADLALRTGGLLIGDDVGLGKTVTGICALADAARRPALVVTLTHLPTQWKAELERFMPGIRVHILKSGQPYDIAEAMHPRRRKRGAAKQVDAFDPGGLPDVIVSNYHKLAGWAGELAGKVKTVIFDEVQELRHAETGKYTAAKRIADAAEVRIGLSATPIFNSGAEFFNIAEVLRPGALGEHAEFVREWLGYGEHVKDPKAFGSFLREIGLMIRRTRADVGRELPELTVVPHMIEADTRELDKVATTATELAKVILSQQGTGFEKLQAAGELDMRIRQATGIAKAPFVADFVRLLVESGEKVVLYGWHHEVYGIWRERLADLGPVFYTGAESPAQKDEAKRAFVDGDAKVLIMSLRAGAGLDGLQKVGRTVVFGELDWSPAVHEQAIGRVHRDGQGDQTVAYFLVADSGSDPIVSDVLGIKRAQIEGIRDPNADPIAASQVDPERIKKLAADFLRQRGEETPAEEEAAA